MTLIEYTELKEKIESLQRLADRASGALETIKKRLKDEFKCETLKVAKSTLFLIAEELTKREEEFEKWINEFEETYANILEEKG